MYFHCRNAREFQKLFHDEGRREYDLKSSVARLKERIVSIVNPRTFVKNSSLRPLLSNNIKVIQGIKSSFHSRRREKKHKSICLLTLPSLGRFYQDMSSQENLMRILLENL